MSEDVDDLSARVEDLLFKQMGSTRYTQNSPILPDVWLKYAKEPGKSQELLLTPHRDSDPSELAACLKKCLEEFARKKKTPLTKAKKRWSVAYNGTTVLANLNFHEMIGVALPLTKWWKKYLVSGESSFVRRLLSEPEQFRDVFLQWFGEPSHASDSDFVADLDPSLELEAQGRNLVWLGKMLALFPELQSKVEKGSGEENISSESDDAKVAGVSVNKRVDGLIRFLQDVVQDASQYGSELFDRSNQHHLWSINLNRKTESALYRSVRAIKADATQSLFDVKGNNICWAVVDSGIDARHMAFRRRNSQGTPLGPDRKTLEFNRGRAVVDGKVIDPNEGSFVQNNETKRWINQTRIVKTLDFSILRDIISSEGRIELLPPQTRARFAADSDLSEQLRKNLPKELRSALKFNRVIDWELFEPFLEVPHTSEYRPPDHHHGTHVAGIIGADWREDEHLLSPRGTRQGIAPAIELYDLRCLDDKGVGDEFSILAAMQYVRSMNRKNNQLQIHGVNLSFSIRHQVANYGCGRTPVCVEAERLFESGVVVVAAAGNQGRETYATKEGVLREAYRDTSITDPGNTEVAITVGATHRYKPHNYGVSYFSSRGPTGDGRLKPDLVAPGEKIYSTCPNNKEVEMDGTSMAAPHVSGAAALLMERNVELIGQPRRVKEILCNSATDLGRERYFQGAGMLDTLRSLQSV